MDEAIAALPGRLHYPIVCHFHKGQSHFAIAQSLGITRSAVSRQVAKGIEQIRKNLRRKGIPVSGVGLSALLAGNAAEAVPTTLTVALGNMALAGTAGTATTATVTSVTTAMGIVTMMKLVVASVIILARISHL